MAFFKKVTKWDAIVGGIIVSILGLAIAWGQVEDPGGGRTNPEAGINIVGAGSVTVAQTGNVFTVSGSGGGGGGSGIVSNIVYGPGLSGGGTVTVTITNTLATIAITNATFGPGISGGISGQVLAITNTSSAGAAALTNAQNFFTTASTNIFNAPIDGNNAAYITNMLNISGAGTSITNLNASTLTFGTVPAARISAAFVQTNTTLDTAMITNVFRLDGSTIGTGAATWNAGFTVGTTLTVSNNFVQASTGATNSFNGITSLGTNSANTVATVLVQGQLPQAVALIVRSPPGATNNTSFAVQNSAGTTGFAITTNGTISVIGGSASATITASALNLIASGANVGIANVGGGANSHTVIKSGTGAGSEVQIQSLGTNVARFGSANIIFSNNFSVVTGTTTIGPNGTAVSNIISATASLIFTNALILDGKDEQPITVTGAKPGDAVFLGNPTNVLSDSTWEAYVVSNNVVNVRRLALVGSTGTTNTWRVVVFGF